ncbi:MAG: hypothetical protein ACTSX6_08160 [Candidatus Heimdallarchaeaceae archaeon]
MKKKIRFLCEWNPYIKQAAMIRPPNWETDGCKNEAVWKIGTSGQWRLCDKCANSKRFRDYKSKIPLYDEEGNLN